MRRCYWRIVRRVGVVAAVLSFTGLRVRARGYSSRRSSGALGCVAMLWWAARLLRLRRSVATFARYWNVRSQAPGEVCFVALGDSAAQGIGASAPARGYVGLLAERIQITTGRSVRVINLSSSGARIAHVRDYQIPRLRALRAPHIVTLAIGGNDVRDRSGTWEDDVAAVLDALPPGAVVADIPDFAGGPGKRHAAPAAVAMRAAVATRDLQPARLEQATTSNMGWRGYAADGFHPSDHGHRVWADAMWPGVKASLADSTWSAKPTGAAGSAGATHVK